jgi:hypothetical protein
VTGFAGSLSEGDRENYRPALGSTRRISIAANYGRRRFNMLTAKVMTPMECMPVVLAGVLCLDRKSHVGFGSWLCENSEIEISDGKLVSSSSICVMGALS